MRCLLAFAAMSLAVGCGDDARRCGPGTRDDGGECVVVDPGAPPGCGNGTVLDPELGQCVVDPLVCGDGTVFVDGECRDPAVGIDVDVVEAPEPNGFESQAIPAGLLAVPAEGGPAVTVHGCVAPVANEPDFDRYRLTTNGPALIRITADGVAGLAAGFRITADPAHPLLGTWQRLGLELASDTARREVFLPAAGTYDLVFTDSRTLFPVTQGAVEVAAGNPDGTSCYYATIERRAITTRAFDSATGERGEIGDELVFYRGPFSTGLTGLRAQIDPAGQRASASLVLAANGELRNLADGNVFDPSSLLFFGGITETDEPLLVLDYLWNYGVAPLPYQVDVQAVVPSQALSTTGGAVSAVSRGRQFNTPAGSDFTAVNLFHFDVAASGDVTGIDFASSIELTGVLIDRNGLFVAQLTGLFGTADSSTTFSSYRGLLRTLVPGRHYFMLYAPRDPVGTAFTVTSTVSPQPLLAAAADAPVEIAISPFGSSALALDGAGEPWRVFAAAGSATGALAVELFDATTAVGRLDDLDARTGPGAGTPTKLPYFCQFACDVRAVVHSFTGGDAPFGRIIRDTPELIVKLTPATRAGTVTVDFARRAYEDFGGVRLADGAHRQLADQALDGGVALRRYYLEAAPGAVVTFDAAPGGALDVALVALAADESEQQVADLAGAGGAEHLAVTVPPSGFVAIVARAGGATAGAFTLDVAVAGP